MLLESKTSQMRLRSRSTRTWIGPLPYRIALVTNSLRISSVANAMSSSPHWVSCRVTEARTSPTAAGSDGTCQSAIRSGPSAWVRATISAMSSLGRTGSRASRTVRQVSSGDRSAPARAVRSISSPTSMSRSRSSTSPSV